MSPTANAWRFRLMMLRGWLYWRFRFFRVAWDWYLAAWGWFVAHYPRCADCGSWRMYVRDGDWHCRRCAGKGLA